MVDICIVLYFKVFYEDNYTCCMYVIIMQVRSCNCSSSVIFLKYNDSLVLPILHIKILARCETLCMYVYNHHVCDHTMLHELM